MHLPFGGAKGGVICDPKRLSSDEKRRITRRYTAQLGPALGPMVDIPAPDVYTDEKTMAWIFDTYDMLHKGQNNLGVVTGKPLTLGGSYGRAAATARGALGTVEEGIGRGLVRGVKTVGEARIVVQGFGNAGAHFARLASERGATILAVSDSGGAIFSKTGLDVARIQKHKDKTGSVAGAKGTERLTNAALLQLDCDVLVPAALENQIPGKNAARVRAKLVAEAANGPTSPAADEILHRRGVVVIPDIL